MQPIDEAYLRDFPDRAIRKLLENRENLRELVADLLPDLADSFDFDAAELLPRGFLLDDWRGRESDLLFRVPFQSQAGEEEEPRSVFVCILVGHQSGADPRMPLRILVYAVLYWEKQWKAWEDGHAEGEPLRLSPVLPIVFHTGNRPWSTHRQLAELIEGPDVLREFAPQWEPLFWDLAERTPEELLEQAGAWLRSLAVVRAERSGEDEFREIFEKALQRLANLAEEERVRWHDLIHFILSWAVRRRPREETDRLKQTAVDSYADQRVKKEIDTMSETLGPTLEEWALERGRNEGLALGEAKGKAEGKAEGDLEARRDVLRSLLEECFGELPDEILRRIAGTTETGRLKAAVRQVLHAKSLDEFEL